MRRNPRCVVPGCGERAEYATGDGDTFCDGHNADDLRKAMRPDDTEDLHFEVAS